MDALALWLFGFFCGSIPFAVLIGNYGIHKEIRDYGDGNPGAFNVLRAGGVAWGGLAVLLDATKGALPVGLATYIVGIEGVPLVLICLAPPLGHAFSPFLRFKGGKAIASVFGVLIGLTLWELTLVGIFMLPYWYFALTSSGWAVMFTAASVLFYVLLAQSNPVWVAVVMLLTLLLAQRHRDELAHPPRFKMSPLLRPVLRLLFSSSEFTRASTDSVHHNGADRH